MKLQQRFNATAMIALINAGLAQAQDFPTRAITLIIPFPPGGVAELTGRPTAMAMEKILKQSAYLVIEGIIN